jgi:hypothetical protein
MMREGTVGGRRFRSYHGLRIHGADGGKALDAVEASSVMGSASEEAITAIFRKGTGVDQTAA